jgi:hypothetical protein
VQDLLLLDWQGSGAETSVQAVAGHEPVQALIARSPAQRFTVSPIYRPPASIRAIVAPAELYHEAHSLGTLNQQGRTLSFTYSLRDAAGGSRVNISGLSVIPMMQQGDETRVPIKASKSCAVSLKVVEQGFGVCSVLLPEALFPTAEADDVLVLLKLVSVRYVSVNTTHLWACCMWHNVSVACTGHAALQLKSQYPLHDTFHRSCACRALVTRLLYLKPQQ